MISREEQRISEFLTSITNPLDATKKKIRQISELLGAIDKLNHKTVNSRVITIAPPGTPTAGLNPGVLPGLYNGMNAEEQRIMSHEITNGLPLLCTQAMVTLWTITEGIVLDSLARLIQFFPEKIDGFREIRVPIVEFQKMDELAKNRTIVELILDGRGLKKKFGSERFFELLKVFGLKPPPLSADHNRALIELHQLRNAIIHNGSKVDLRILQVCPWLNAKLNDPIQPNVSDIARYEKGALACFNMTNEAMAREVCPIIERLERGTVES